MKRVAGTPKMGPGVIPGSPMPEMQNRGSPAPGFEAPVPQGVRSGQFFNNGMGGNPAMMGGQQPPSSHPGGFNMQMQNMNPQVMEQMRMANGGRYPNGQPFQQQPPQMMPGNQPQQVGTPQQRNTTMPPPPAPSQEQQRTQPSSPANPPAPPTPSAAPKSAPKGKKENMAKKKTAPKKGATAATPVADSSEPPPTPTPSTPITPMHQASFNNKNGQPPNAQPNQVQAAPQQAMDSTGASFADVGQDTGFGNLDFAIDGPDVLENFDFDSFLHNTEDTGFSDFGLINFGNENGVEAGAD
jgi:hypothetical protein